MSKRARPPLPDTRVEVRLAGSGGQGIILAGLILAEAAGIHEGREVTMIQSYGPEARGGASKAEIIISDDPVDYPLCMNVDVFVALNQEAADTYGWDLKPGAVILVDEDLVPHPPSSRALAFPFTAVARDKLQQVTVANVLALGAFSEITGLVGRRALEKSLAENAPRGSEQVNRKALSVGARIARDHAREKSDEEAEQARTEDI